MRIISEEEFKTRIIEVLKEVDRDGGIGCVTGPGRSGAVAAVYASHLLRIPFVPFGTYKVPTHLGKILVIDTARESGKTLRQAVRRYEKIEGAEVIEAVCFEEPPRVAFWYEAEKPQFYRHERKKLDEQRTKSLEVSL
jgi:adenine/guanine phosphoribosyltransferase-like PRPP-binding protein